jgi:hypothetical protein
VDASTLSVVVAIFADPQNGHAVGDGSGSGSFSIGFTGSSTRGV